MAARSDHSRALPEGSASTRSTRFPAWAKMWASQTAEVVLPVPGLRLSRATLSAVINAVLQYLRHYGSPSGRYWRTAPPGLNPQASHLRCPRAQPAPWMAAPARPDHHLQATTRIDAPAGARLPVSHAGLARHQCIVLLGVICALSNIVRRQIL